MKRSYNLKIDKYFSKDFDNVVIELTVSKELTDLLKKFIVPDEEMIDTQWLLKASNEDDNCDTELLRRYRIKTVLKSSLRWSYMFDLFFTKELIANQKIIVPLTTVRMFTDIQSTISEVKELVAVMERINTDKSISVNIEVKE